MKILIVDDNADNQYMLRSLLEGNGHTVIEASEGEEALNKLKEEPIDLIISDILMPIMDGFTLCWEVHKAACFQHIPFIIYTATYTGLQDEELALELGADRFIVKPCEPETFLQAIKEVVGASASNVSVKIPLLQTEEEILKLYNERLIKKLEQKMLQSEEEVRAKMEALDSLRRSEALLNTTQSISKIGGWEWDIENQEMFWTPEMFRMHDLEPTDDVEKGTKNISLSIKCYAPEERHLIAEAFIDCCEKGIPYELECKFTTHKGRKLYVRTAGQPVFEGAKIVKVIGNIQDISESKKNELKRIELLEQLRKTQRLDSIGQLAGGVAHDFNNILAVMLGYSEEIFTTIKKEDPIYKDMEEIIKAGKKALNLTRQLLTFSRKHVVQPQILNLNNIIQEMSKMFVRIVREDIELSCNTASDLGNIKADIVQIEQVLMNLVINAREAMSIGGKLSIKTENVIIDELSAEKEINMEPGEYVMLSVSDTGCGMNKEISDRIFEPFFTTKNNRQSTGLGLSTVYGIINQSKGFIKLDSEPGKGTTFTLYFPKTDDELIPILEEHDAFELHGYGEHIVIVEDDTAMGVLTKKMLKKLDYKVTLFESAEEAIINIVDGGLVPDLVITDVVMPGINGKELADTLHKTLHELKIIFMSGYSDSVIVEHGVMDRDSTYIQKPFSKESIAQKVKYMLKSRSNPHQKIAHVLMIDDDENVLALYSRAFLQRGHIFISTVALNDAVDELSKQDVEVILVDMNIPGTDGISIIKAIREAGYLMPAIALSGDINCIDSSSFQSLNIVSSFEKSSNILPLIEIVERMLEKKQ